jgi:hypothetical protein
VEPRKERKEEELRILKNDGIWKRVSSKQWHLL